MRLSKDQLELYLSKVEVKLNPDTNCLLVASNHDTYGYPQILITKFYPYPIRLHRIVAHLGQKLNDLFDPKIKVRHACDNTACIQLSHLEPGSQKDNMEDMVKRKRHANQKKTHCRNGHEFTEENTVVINNLGRNSERGCKICRAANLARFRAKNN